MEALTGLTGAALLAYFLVSERLADPLPARNLHPPLEVNVDRDRAALLGTLAAAFGDAPPVPRDQLVTGTIGPGSEAEETVEALAGHRWLTLPFEAVDRVRDRVALLTPAAWRYYLPGFLWYLLADLPGLQRADVFADALLVSLTRPTAGGAREDVARAEGAGVPDVLGADAWAEVAAYIEGPGHEAATQMFDERVKPLTQAQREAVREVLSYLAARHAAAFVSDEPRVALERYWGVRSPG